METLRESTSNRYCNSFINNPLKCVNLWSLLFNDMGYNGGINKRGYYRRNHGMYRKSSYRSGEKILSGLILGGLGLVATAVSSASSPNNTSTRKRKTTTNQYTYTPPPKPLSIEDSILNQLTSDKFRKLKNDYDTVVANNIQIKNTISKLQRKLRWNNLLKTLLYFIPKWRLAFDAKFKGLNDSITSEQQRIIDPIIDTNALLANDSSKVRLMNRGKILMAFYNVSNESYLNDHKTLSVSEPNENYFKYNCSAAGILHSRLIQLHLFPHGIIVMGKNTFGIIDYRDITAHYTTLYIKTRYVESGLKVVRKTWLHAKMNGDRDLRYNENYEINLVEYGCLKLNFSDNLTINILFSDASYGTEVASLFTLTPYRATAISKVYNTALGKEAIDITPTPKIYTTTYNKATLTQTEKELCDAIRRYGKPLNTRIAYKRPQIGSSVKRRSDGAVLEVVNISIDHMFKCYDFAKDDCFLYTRDELMLS